MTTLRLPFFGDKSLSFQAICAQVSEREAAERVVEEVLSTPLSALEIEVIAMALIHSRHLDLGEKILDEKFRENTRDKFKTSSAKEFAVLCAHLSLLQLQRAIEGKDPDQSIEKANDLASEASTIDPRAPMQFLTQAYCQLLRDQDHCNQAQELFNFVKTNMENVIPFVDLRALVEIGSGIVRFRQENYEEANQHFKWVLEHYSSAVPMIRLAIGQTLLAQKKDRAEYAFKATLEKDPNNPVALTALALINFNSPTGAGDLTQAIEYNARALAANPNYAPAILVKAVLKFFGNKKNVLNTLKQAARQGEDNSRVIGEVRYQAGRVQHRKGNLEDAKKHYRGAVESNPKHERANFSLGLFALAEGNPEEAVRYCKVAEHGLHEFFEFNAVMGLAYAQLSQKNDQKSQEYRKEAVKYLKTALEQPGPKTEVVKVRRTLGWLHIKSLEFTEAETQLAAAVEMEEAPDDQLLLFLGIAQFQAGKAEAALQTFSRCANQEEPILRFNTGRCLEELNRFSDAKQTYNKLHEDFPSFSEPLIRLAAMALRDSRPNIVNTEAKGYLETVIKETDSCETLALLELGNVNARCQQLREASHHMNIAQQKSNGGDGYLYATVSLGNYYLHHAQSKRSEEDPRRRVHFAQESFLKALRENPHCFAAANGMALCWLLLGHIKEAKEQLKVVKDYGPEMSSSFENLGLAYMREGECASAMKLFEEANKKFYDKTDVNLLLQTYHAYKGDKKFDECLTVAEQLCSLRPEYDNNWYFLATCLHKVVLKQSSTRSVDESKIREKTVNAWIRQMERAASLLENFLETPSGRSIADAIKSKIKSIRDQRSNRLERLLEIARNNDKKRQQQFQIEAEKVATPPDPAEDVPRPE